jgi:hypothetical protein
LFPAQDISVVKIIYKKSTVFLIGSRSAMTWIDYFSVVGKTGSFRFSLIFSSFLR